MAGSNSMFAVAVRVISAGLVTVAVTGAPWNTGTNAGAV